MKTILASAAVIVCICLIGQAASGFVAKTPSTSLVTLAGCDSGYLVKDCENKETIKRTKSYSINLTESLKMDTGDKKKDAKTEKKPDTKKVVKSSKYKTCDKYKDSSKKYNACKKAIDKKSQKTKHDTVKNSIGNVR